MLTPVDIVLTVEGLGHLNTDCNRRCEQGNEARLFSRGQRVTKNTEQKSHSCNNCGHKPSRILQCKTVKYCDSKCQKEHWQEHRILCNATHKLSKTSLNNRNLPDDTSRFQMHLIPKQWSKVASLIGKKFMVKCFLNENEVQALWDTGSQVSIVSESLLREKFKDKCIKHISERINAELNPTAANVGEMPIADG